MATRNSSRPAAQPGKALETAELAESLGYLLRRSQLAYKKNFLRVAVDNVQPGQVGVILLIGRNPGIMPSQISTELGIEPAQVTAFLGKLDQLGLLDRSGPHSDGRSRPVCFTKQGERHFAVVSACAMEAETSFTDGVLGPDEAATLRRLLARLVAGQGS